ncbi:MAG: hypothetical protein NHF90_00345, partial [Candidatus Shikimatogenerans sp. JK-2022]|nr:hypothetical protein [Candidatus Shikimatogenerans bostrichidophilus]
TNINIYKIINILSLRSYEINEEKKIYMKKIFLLLRIPKNKLFFLYLKKQIIKINYLPISTYLATLELLNKRLIIKK